jgi:hypothetical protein
VSPKIRVRAMTLMTLLTLVAQAHVSPDYAKLRRVVRANTGFAHITRGMNMYTLIALRSCVSEEHIGVLSQMLGDPDPIVRMTSANVLVDLGPAGKQAVMKQFDDTTDPGRRAVLRDALYAVESPTYRPIMEYASNETTRRRVRGCLGKTKTTRP